MTPDRSQGRERYPEFTPLTQRDLGDQESGAQIPAPAPQQPGQPDLSVGVLRLPSACGLVTQLPVFSRPLDLRTAAGHFSLATGISPSCLLWI